MLVVRMHLWKSSGCYAYECHVPLLEVFRIGKTRHVYSWGNPDEVNSDDNVCHASLGDVCHVWEGVPTASTSIHTDMIAISVGSGNISWVPFDPYSWAVYCVMALDFACIPQNFNHEYVNFSFITIM